ncbi:MAG: two-component system sensor histidine kinase NtrB, partial [Candidatus Sumerlaeia bacterium]
MSPKAFAERFLAHLDKIDPSEVENFVRRTVQERDFVVRIFDALTEGIVVIDPDSRITLVNPAARRILQWTPKRRLVGEALLDELDDGPLREVVEDFISNPRLIQNEEMAFSPKSNKVYNLHIIPITDPDNDNAAYGAAALILQDLTLSRDKQARDAQAEKLASLFTLTAGVAHEIKNPLNSLSIHAQLLEKAARNISSDSGKMPRKTAIRVMQSCNVIGEEVERLRQCVDDFIEAARPHKPHLAPAALNPIVESVIRTARLEAEERGIQIREALEPDLPVLMLDEKQVRSALRNLIRNSIEAIEAARRPAGEGQINIRTSTLEDMVTLEVADNGCGVSDDDLPKLFEPYFTTKFNGSGLGLMAVARIMREHSGLVSVKSDLDEGAAFVLEFPIVNRKVKLLE